VHYWALGGRHTASQTERADSLIVYPGTPQARKPQEVGAHGCCLVRVDTGGKPRAQTIDVDTVRWQPQKIAIAESATLDQLKNVLGERALKLAMESADHSVLVHWHLATSGQFNPEFRKKETLKDLLDWLRDEFGRSEKGIWSTELTIDPPKALPAEWYEEDTMLGEYLRAIGRYQSDDSLQLSFHDYLTDSDENDSVSDMGRVAADAREEILQQATAIGIDYLAACKE
jgi:DNA repair exonuclease SbcCD nuclease subunit